LIQHRKSEEEKNHFFGPKSSNPARNKERVSGFQHAGQWRDRCARTQF